MDYPEFYIIDKKFQKVLFIPNSKQEELFEAIEKGNLLIVKARQRGITTGVQLYFLADALSNDNVSCATIAYKADRSEKIFRIAKNAFKWLPKGVQALYDPNYDNVRELQFGSTNSSIYVDTDTRGGTVQKLLLTDFTKHPKKEAILSGSLESVPSAKEGGRVIIESTACGLDVFYELVQEALDGKNEFNVLFVGWTDAPEYREKLPDGFDLAGEYAIVAKKYNLDPDAQKKYGLDNEQLYWYYLKAKRHRELVKQEYPLCLDEAFVASAVNVFDLEKVRDINEIEPIEKRGEVDIYELPKEGIRYIVGIDPAEGIGGDNSVISVWYYDQKEGKFKQVAEYRGQCNSYELSDKALMIAQFYNKAFIVPERNGNGLTVCLRLLEKYGNIFMDINIAKVNAEPSAQVGWRTDALKRPVMIDEFENTFDDGKIVIRSRHLKEEMKVFVRDKKGNRKALEGKHDDCLFGAFLAFQGHKYNQAPTLSF